MIDSYPSLRADWSYPTKVRFGPGRIAELPDAVSAAGIARPLVVSDPSLKASPLVIGALALLEEASIPAALFADIQGNPVAANVEAGVARFHENGHDGVVLIGGGSAMDAGKAIAFMAGQTRPIWEFEDREDWWTRADPAGISPCVAVPTTAGTGSEMGRAAVITDETDHTKKVIFHPKMLPVEVIADPELTVGLPADITAATGMDALSHNLEAYSSPAWHPMGQGIALEGMRLVKEWLPKAVDNGRNIEARAFMLAASSMGAVAFQKGLGAMHAMSHPCSSLRGTHHGLTNAVVMPYVLVHNQKAISEKMAALGRYLDLPRQDFSGVLDWIVELRAGIGIPGTLADLGIQPDLIPQLAPMALADPTTGGNPLDMDVPAYERLYRNAIEGRLG